MCENNLKYYNVIIMSTYKNRYNLEIVLTNEAESEEEAAEKALRQLSNIQVNLCNEFTTTNLLLDN